MRSTRGCAARAGSRTGRGPRGSSRGAGSEPASGSHPPAAGLATVVHGCVAAVRRPEARALVVPGRTSSTAARAALAARAVAASGRRQRSGSRPCTASGTADRHDAVVDGRRHARGETGARRHGARRAQRLARQHVVTEGLAQTGIALETAHQQADLVRRQLAVEQCRHLFADLVCHRLGFNRAMASGCGRSPRGPGRSVNGPYLPGNPSLQRSLRNSGPRSRAG